MFSANADIHRGGRHVAEGSIALFWLSAGLLPVHSDEQTFAVSDGMSQTGQFRTHAPHQGEPYSMTSSARASSDEVTDRDLPAASDSNERRLVIARQQFV